MQAPNTLPKKRKRNPPGPYRRPMPVHGERLSPAQEAHEFTNLSGSERPDPLPTRHVTMSLALFLFLSWPCLSPSPCFSLMATPHGGHGGEIGVFRPNNQRQHRTVHTQKFVLPYVSCSLLRSVSTTLADIFRRNSISTFYMSMGTGPIRE